MPLQGRRKRRGRLSEPVGGTVATAHGNATGTARQIGTGANPSERRERHGGRLRRVWREPVGGMVAAIVRTRRRTAANP